MDEPTAGLDPNQIRHFRENIRKLGRDKTILVSTHILQEVEAIADHVLFVHNGRLVFEGTARRAQGRRLAGKAVLPAHERGRDAEAKAS